MSDVYLQNLPFPQILMDLKGCQAPQRSFFGKNPARNARNLPKDEINGIVIWITEQRSPRKQSKAATPDGKTPEFHEKTEK